jgi:acetylornithine deacetylase/succinyl-diaminopimelate desuccinylase-like protein
MRADAGFSPRCGCGHDEDDDEAVLDDKDCPLRAIENYFSRSNRFRAQVGTTIATDLIGGGVKSNALPEEAWSVVNHRIGDRRRDVFLAVAYLLLTER